MIQDIKHLSSELELDRLMDWEIAMNSKIPLVCAKSSQRIPRQVSLAYRKTGYRVNGGGCESFRVKRFATGVRGSIQIKWSSYDDIWPDLGLKALNRICK